MKRNEGIYVLLVGASSYEEQGMEDLPAVREDLSLMKEICQEGLLADSEHIRVLGEDGIASRRDFARAMAEFGKLLKEGDTFLFYFSGHGREGELVLSDGPLLLDSVMRFLSALGISSTLAILDCCYAGGARVGQVPFGFTKSLALLSGSGAAVMASCGAGQRSWLTEGGKYSLYTYLLGKAVFSRRGMRKGRISLTDIQEEVRFQMGQWNKSHPEKAQTPVFRECLYGTIFFPVEEYHPTLPALILFEREDYAVVKVKPLSTQTQKRLAVFVIVKAPWDGLPEKAIPEMTREICPSLAKAEVFGNEAMAKRHRGRAADVIWCYFGQDEEDIERGNHFAYSIWAPSEERKAVYYRKNQNAKVIDGIYVFQNSAYQLVKEMQKSSRPIEETIGEYRHLCNLLIERAESFLEDIEEAENETVSFEEVKGKNQGWIIDVKRLFLRLTDAEVLPVKSAPWGEAVLEVAGLVVDLALFLEHTGQWEDAQDKWLIKSTIQRYEQSLDYLGQLEREGSGT